MLKILLTASAIAILLLMRQLPASAQQVLPQQPLLTPSEKVDSAFTTTLMTIRDKMRTKQRLPVSQISFVYMLGFLSGLNFNLESYSGYPTLTQQDVERFTSWYAIHKEQIEWHKVQRGLTLVNTPPTEDITAELEALKIK